MIKKYGKYAVGAFAIFYLLSNPAGAADAVNSGAENLRSATNSLSIFVNGVGK